jgi:hypothetical protein
MKSAAGGTEWLNIVLDYDNEMYHAGIVNKFLQNESLIDQVWEIKYPELFHDGLRGFVLQSKEKSMVWVHNKQSIWYTRVQGESPNPAENAVIRIPVSGNGEYRVEFWNTYTGEIFRTETKRAVSKRISLTLPKIENDIALKVILLD